MKQETQQCVYLTESGSSLVNVVHLADSPSYINKKEMTDLAVVEVSPETGAASEMHENASHGTAGTHPMPFTWSLGRSAFAISLVAAILVLVLVWRESSLSTRTMTTAPIAEEESPIDRDMALEDSILSGNFQSPTISRPIPTVAHYPTLRPTQSSSATTQRQHSIPRSNLTDNERILTEEPGSRYVIDARRSFILIDVSSQGSFAGYIDANHLGSDGAYFWKVGDSVRCRENNLIRYDQTGVIAGSVPTHAVGTVVEVERGLGRKVVVEFPLQLPLSRLLFDPWHLIAAEHTQPDLRNYHAVVISANAGVYNLGGKCVATLDVGTKVSVRQQQTAVINAVSGSDIGNTPE